MGEVIQFPGEYQRRIAAAELIGYTALSEVTERYGDGLPGSELIPVQKPLAYHNMQHTMSVIEHARELSSAVGLDEYDTSLVAVAAAAHDIDHTSPRGQMELMSAQWLSHEMRAARFPRADIQMVVAAVIGTEPLYKDGIMIDQKVSHLKFANTRAATVAKVVAAADMANIYAPNGPLLGGDLYQESQGVPAGHDTPMENFAAFQRGQLAVATVYRFPVTAGERLYAGLRPEIVQHHRWVLESVLAGRIRTWGQLVEVNEDFYVQHAT
jgi:hypothetical protein